VWLCLLSFTRAFLLGKEEPEVAASGAALEEPARWRKGGDVDVVFNDMSGARDRSERVRVSASGARNRHRELVKE
jgi:hypothetical protein